MTPRHQSSSSSSSDAQSSSSQQINFTTIIVSNLTINISEDHLKQIFSNFGQIQSLGIRQSQSKNHLSEVNRHAMINYSQQKDAQTAVQYMDDGWLDGLKIRVKMDNQDKQPDTQKAKILQAQQKRSFKDIPLGKSHKNNSTPFEDQKKRQEDSLSEIEPRKKDRLHKKSFRKSSHKKQDRRRHDDRNRRYDRSRSPLRKNKKPQSSKSRREKSYPSERSLSQSRRGSSKNRRNASSSSSRSSS